MIMYLAQRSFRMTQKKKTAEFMSQGNATLGNYKSTVDKSTNSFLRG